MYYLQLSKQSHRHLVEILREKDPEVFLAGKDWYMKMKYIGQGR